jgi:UDP-N-acetylglucosamine--dolichyl-phosphate N-acetylglucosaminephosphotransferase
LKACTIGQSLPKRSKKGRDGEVERLSSLLEILAAFIVALVTVLLFMPSAIRVLGERGSTGIDVHKPEKPEVPKGGGFILLFGLVFGLLLVLGLTTFQSLSVESVGILGALVSILMAGIIGLLDDQLDFSARTKIALPLVSTIPMMALSVGTPTMTIPIIGTVNFGIWYALVIVPLMMTFIIDATNMYGGMNGLESGLSIINSSGLVFYVVISNIVNGHIISENEMQAAVVAAALLGASLAFFAFNRYPAKVLPGDVGRLPMGAAIAAALIIGNMDRLAIVMFIPFGINFLLYLAYRFHVKRTGEEWAKFASPRKDGTLEVKGPYTVYWLLPYFSKRVTERKNVRILLLLQAILVYGAVFVFIYLYPFGR